MSIAIIGGGAAGFFAAINAAEQHPGTRVVILERTGNFLAKVKISGGGRCNVTNACFEPKELVKNYPRGSKELLSCFYRFQPKDTTQWFSERGVELQAEADGRMFPVSNSSQTIIECFMGEAHKLGVEIITNADISSFAPIENGEAGWRITYNDTSIDADKLIIASGSNENIWDMLAELGYTIVPPVPSLFTFNCNDSRIGGLPGVSVANAVVGIKESNIKQNGPVLITHWGFSGPAILKLSAWGARELAERDYACTLVVNWMGQFSPEQVFEKLIGEKRQSPNKKIHAHAMFELPQRLWESLLASIGIAPEKMWNDIAKDSLRKLADELTRGQFTVSGKAQFKEEFVTCGGVDLKQVDCKTMQSKLHKNLFFAGEVLNIDGITGGFNFQAAWTTAYIASGI
jgi:predicted Rossmann fold flavoprotein